MSQVIKIESSDEVTIDLSLKAALQSKTLADLIQNLNCDDGSTVRIPIPNVKGSIMEKISEWCEMHKDSDANPAKGPTEWDKKFLHGLDNKTFHEMMSAANYLNIKNLMDALKDAFVRKLRGKTTTEMRKVLGTPTSVKTAAEQREEDLALAQKPFHFRVDLKTEVFEEIKFPNI